jgi:hypothetical protein
MSEHPLPPRARAILVCDAAGPVARAVALRLADLGHLVLAASPDAAALADLPRETARSGLIEVAVGPLAASPARALAAFGRLDTVILTSETWAFGPTFGPGTTAGTALPQRPLVAESLDLLRAFHEQPDHLPGHAPGPATRRRIVFASTLPSLPFTGVGPAQHRAFEALARAIRVELRAHGADVCMVTSDLVAPPPGAESLGSRFARAIAALPDDSAYRRIAGPLEKAVLALARQAPPVTRVADAVVKAALSGRARNLVKVRGSGGRLAVPVALRALDKATRKAPRA